MKAIQIIVSGRVQGVCFRAYTQKLAHQYGINGYVKNRDDGAVEIVACADQEQLDCFIRDCHKGPVMAKVDELVINELAKPEKFSYFAIR